MRLQAPLDEIIGGKTSIRVLRMLARFPEKEFTGRELARFAEAAHSSVIVELERFREVGLVTRRLIGSAHVWRANPQHELFRILSPAFERERRIRDELLLELARGVADRRISRAVLFGSVARGDEKPGSDVDLMVFVRRASDVEKVKSLVEDLAFRVHDRFGLLLSPIVHSESELPRLRKTALYANLVADGKTLKGEPL